MIAPREMAEQLPQPGGAATILPAARGRSMHDVEPEPRHHHPDEPPVAMPADQHVQARRAVPLRQSPQRRHQRQPLVPERGDRGLAGEVRRHVLRPVQSPASGAQRELQVAAKQGRQHPEQFRMPQQAFEHRPSRPDAAWRGGSMRPVGVQSAAAVVGRALASSVRRPDPRGICRKMSSGASGVKIRPKNPWKPPPPDGPVYFPSLSYDLHILPASAAVRGSAPGRFHRRADRVRRLPTYSHGSSAGRST